MIIRLNDFEKEFPSFKLKIPQGSCNCKDCDKPLYCRQIIEDHCLDKQKVREVIKKFSNDHNVDGLRIETKNEADAFLKELGL